MDSSDYGIAAHATLATVVLRYLMTLLALRDISKDFGIKEILRDASFSIEDGARVGLIGTNGSGKSPLLKMIAGLEPNDSGEYELRSARLAEA